MPSHRLGPRRYASLCVPAALLAVTSVAAKEDIEFVQEHLPEVAMDNRYATLPIWNATATGEAAQSTTLQASYMAAGAGKLEILGPMLSVGRDWPLSGPWRFGALAFFDRLELRAATEQRDLQTLFAPDTPLERPSAAEFRNLDGVATDVGFGARLSKLAEGGFLGRREWTLGLLWQRVSLRDYRFDYAIEAGPDAGVTGTIDFDAQYKHVVPFGGLSVLRDHGRWTTNAHVLVAYPLPRRGVVGHITGPDFDIHGNTEDVGNGKHFGDPSITFGYSITYQPTHVSFDLGGLVTQALLEPHVHPGIDRNLLLSFSVALE